MMTRLPPRYVPLALWLGRWAPVLCAVAVGLMVAADAEARVGGGQRYSRPSSGRSSGGSGGSGDGLGMLIYLLIRLCIEVPIIGIPLTLAVIGFFIWRATRSSGRVVLRTEHVASSQGHVAPRRRAGPRLDPLLKSDPSFSEPVFLDFAILVHRRAMEAFSTGTWEPMGPYVTEMAQKQLALSHEKVSRVDNVVVGGVRIVRLARDGDQHRLDVVFEDTRTETIRGGGTRDVIVHERWTFRRAASATSLPPQDMQRLGCPSCGAAVETDSLGACTNCDTPITAGQLQWQVDGVEVGQRSRVVAPEVGFFQGGDEGSVHVPVLQDPSLQAEARKLLSRHPGLTMDGFGQRVSLVFHELQSAWSDSTWDKARPYVTDAQFQSLRFWMDRYKKHGLQNKLEDVELERTTVVKIGVDAWYESITVRIVGKMRDYVVDTSTGKTVGGNAKVPRRFAEYWTFLRASGTDGTTKGNERGCPSCGAPLDQVNQSGICGYCDTKITTGQFDWVLARIEQPEAYRG